MNKKYLVSKAKSMGNKAKLAGNSRVPAHNAELMQMVKDNGMAKELMTAWLQGWDETHQQTTDRILRDMGF